MAAVLKRLIRFCPFTKSTEIFIENVCTKFRYNRSNRRPIVATVVTHTRKFFSVSLSKRISFASLTHPTNKSKLNKHYTDVLKSSGINERLRK